MPERRRARRRDGAGTNAAEEMAARRQLRRSSLPLVQGSTPPEDEAHAAVCRQRTEAAASNACSLTGGRRRSERKENGCSRRVRAAGTASPPRVAREGEGAHCSPAVRSIAPLVRVLLRRRKESSKARRPWFEEFSRQAAGEREEED